MTNKISTIIIMMLGLLIYADEPTVTHKCADFVAISADEKLFNAAIMNHQVLRKALEGGVAQLDPKKVLPIWNDPNRSSFGYDFESVLIIFCWFTPQMKAGVFYFEGYSATEARKFVLDFQMEFKEAAPLDGALMYDGIENFEKLFQSFPRLRQTLRNEAIANGASK